MGGRLLEGPTMVGRTWEWKRELGRFLKPFLDRFGHKARRQMCPLYVSGLIGPGDRKSIAAMAKRTAPGDCEQMRPIAPLHCRRGLGCSAGGSRIACSSG